MRLSDLYQCTYWASNGEQVRLEDMTVGHRVNLVRWLERRAEVLQQAELYDLCNFEDAGDLTGAFDEDPLAWLHSTPLVRRLDELIEGDMAPQARAWLRNRWFHLRKAVRA